MQSGFSLKIKNKKEPGNPYKRLTDSTLTTASDNRLRAGQERGKRAE